MPNEHENAAGNGPETENSTTVPDPNIPLVTFDTVVEAAEQVERVIKTETDKNDVKDSRD